MAKLNLILVSGRSTKQGTGISTGKEGSEYREVTNMVEMNPSDMEQSGLRDGDPVQLKSEFGMIDVICRRGDVPEGLAFIAFGSACNRLVGEETYSSGMPDSKHLNIEVMPLPI